MEKMLLLLVYISCLLSRVVVFAEEQTFSELSEDICELQEMYLSNRDEVLNLTSDALVSQRSLIRNQSYSILHLLQDFERDSLLATLVAEEQQMEALGGVSQSLEMLAEIKEEFDQVVEESTAEFEQYIEDVSNKFLTPLATGYQSYMSTKSFADDLQKRAKQYTQQQEQLYQDVAKVLTSIDVDKEFTEAEIDALEQQFKSVLESPFQGVAEPVFTDFTKPPVVSTPSQPGSASLTAFKSRADALLGPKQAEDQKNIAKLGPILETTQTSQQNFTDVFQDQLTEVMNQTGPDAEVIARQLDEIIEGTKANSTPVIQNSRDTVVQNYGSFFMQWLLLSFFLGSFFAFAIKDILISNKLKDMKQESFDSSTDDLTTTN